MNDNKEFREMIQSLTRLNERMFEFWQKADSYLDKRINPNYTIDQSLGKVGNFLIKTA
jgi:hypothetical protein